MKFSSVYFIITFCTSLRFCFGTVKSTVNNSEINKLGQMALKKLKEVTGRSSKLEEIFKISKKAVSGTLTTLSLQISERDITELCRVEIMHEPWLKETILVSYNCTNWSDIDKQIETKYIDEKALLNMFNKFVNEYNKTYSSDEEYNIRFQIFRSSLEQIKTLRENEQGTAKYGITQFSDMTEEELENYMGLIPLDEKFDEMPVADSPEVQLPDTFDWRNYNVVTPVKDQKACGSCWVFAAVGNIEGQWALKTGNLVSLSEQQIMDCNDNGNGCHGGSCYLAYRTVKEMGGLESESDYPYFADDFEDCEFDSNLIVASISGSKRIREDEVKIAQWLYKNGPVAAGLEGRVLLHYKGGVIHPPRDKCVNTTHAVLIVGFGVDKSSSNEENIPFWIIKNSWGHKWGEDGYFRLYRGDNTCKINRGISSAIIN